MDEATRVRIFEPFFTTRVLGVATGLGQAFAHGIVVNNGGTIAVASKPGLGTTFVIDLPLVVTETGRTPTPPVAYQAAVTPALVLVIEDEEGIRRLLEKILVPADFEVISVASGREALALAATATHAPAIILSDVVLADTRATAILPALKHRWPEARVVLISGYIDELIQDQLEVQGLLPKPFEPADVIAILRHVLGTPP